MSTRRNRTTNGLKIISDMTITGGKILPFLKRGTKEEDNPFIPRSLARSPVNRNNDEEKREIDIDTPSEYSEQSDYNTPMVVKSKRRNEPLIKTAMRRHNNNNNNKITRIGIARWK
jgi:hypothetical protein